jgi:hypothetical protein
LTHRSDPCTVSHSPPSAPVAVNPIQEPTEVGLGIFEHLGHPSEDRKYPARLLSPTTCGWVSCGVDRNRTYVWSGENKYLSNLKYYSYFIFLQSQHLETTPFVKERTLEFVNYLQILICRLHESSLSPLWAVRHDF